MIQSRTIPRKGFKRVTIRLVSSDEIIQWSHGEVVKPETINYRSFRPEKGGLFCEKIFGPVRDWECACGKYKRIRYKGIVCDRCGVEVTSKSVRRERFGHIMLAVPVVHIWYHRIQPSKVATVLGMPTKDVDRIIYYESYVVIQPGSSGLHRGALLTEEEYRRILENLPPSEKRLPDDDPRKFRAAMGGVAIKELLRQIDPVEEAHRLREQLKEEKSEQKKKELLKRLRVLEAFRPSEDRRPNKLEWMVLDAIPVIPPELRPLVPLEGGRFAASDLNELYRRVIIRNNRLKRLLDIKAPDVILRNEKRMLQEAVDALFDSTRQAKTRSTIRQKRKSLSDILRGKQGRFRQNLLGKRVDYSGRSVIVVGPTLKIHECGLPKDMALELYKPFVIRKLIERGYVKTVKTAKRLVEVIKPDYVWEILEKVIQNHPVLLNRAPTLHRLGIQAFQPRLIEGKAIRLHPLVCTAFNADFDGDQMAVHVPLSNEAQLEAILLMLSAHNILNPQNGTPITVPSQDMVLGLYYLTKVRRDEQQGSKVFASEQEVMIALDQKKISLHTPIKVRINGEIIETTAGRVLFNQIVPEELGFVNELLTKKRLRQLIAESFQKAGMARTVEFLDELKDLGFHYSTLGGLSVNVEDLIVPPEKEEIIQKAQEEIDKIEQHYRMGVITAGERYNKIIDVWSSVTNRVADKLYTILQKDKDGFNPFWMMLDSQARGSKEQIRQLAGMRGLMAKPRKTIRGGVGELIENPVISNFKEGLSVLEYFISTHGARKGLADTALKTADAGYLTRRLHDVAQDIVVREVDCGTIRGIEMRALKEGEDIKEPLYERILGRIALVDVIDPLTDEVIVNAGEMIDEEKAQKIAETSIESVWVRSVLTCETQHGVCAKCYGRDLATGELVSVGEAVGTIASQSIGEPGTQLTLRTFHTGGTASLMAAQSVVTAKFDGIVRFEHVRILVTHEDEGDVDIVANRGGVLKIVEPQNNRELVRYNAMYGARLRVKDGDRVQKGQILYEWDPYNNIIFTEVAGYVRFKDFIENITYQEELDEQTGHISKTVIESRERGKSPTIEIVGENGKVVQSYILPTGAQVTVDEGEYVGPGTLLAKIPRDIGKTHDITGGLPRVTELFEARVPQKAAIITEIEGRVTVHPPRRGVRKVEVTSFDGRTTKEYQIPVNKYLLVQDGDTVHAGDPLTEGPLNPHDILRIKGIVAVQEYLLNEIQEVYRMQGVSINDKHIEIIIRQMLQKVRITFAGDSPFLENDYVDRQRFLEENEKLQNMYVVEDKGDSKYRIGELISKDKLEEVNQDLKSKGKKLIEARPAEPAVAEPVLLGITQAALTTESFLSAASFQETTRVLSEAALAAKVDYLRGLKENIILGQLIPAGTGVRKYQDIVLEQTGKSIFAREEEFEMLGSDGEEGEHTVEFG